MPLMNRPEQVRVRNIVELFDGIRPLSRALTARGRRISGSAIFEWIKRGHIHSRWYGVLLEIARARGLTLTPETLIGIGEHEHTSKRD